MAGSPFSAAVQVNPSSLVASTATTGQNPTLTTLVNFTYPTKSDTVKNVTVDLGAGVLANPASVTTQCSQAQFSANTCPAASQIGGGTATAYTADNHGGGGNGLVSLPIKLFLIPQPGPVTSGNPADAGDPSALAQIGLIAYLDGVPQVFSQAGAKLSTSHPGQVELTFSNLPSSVQIGGNTGPTENVQVTSIALTISPTVGGNPFTIQSSQCNASPVSLIQATDTASTTSGVGQSAFTPTGCAAISTLPLAGQSGTGDAPANASTGTAQTAQVQVLPDVKGTFIAGPSTKQILANPALTTTFNFTYADSSATSNFVFSGPAPNGNCVDNGDGTYTCSGLANGAAPYLVSTSTSATPDTGEAVCEAMMAMTYDGSGNQTTSSANCAWIKTITVNLAAGLLANPTAVNEYCALSVWQAASAQGSTTPACPLDSQIANGSANAITLDDPVDGAFTTENNLAVKLYLIPAQSSSELAEVGAIVYLSGSPVTGVVGSATLLPTGAVHLVFNNIPQTAVLNNALQYVQITRLTLTVNANAQQPTGTISTTGTTTTSSTVVTAIPSTTGIAPGDSVLGVGIPAGTTVASVNSSSQITLSSGALLGAAGTAMTIQHMSFASTGTTALSSNTITAIPSTSQFAVGDPISGTGIPNNATVTSVDSPSQMHISALATVAGTGVALQVSPVLPLTVNPSGCQTSTSSATVTAIADTKINTQGTLAAGGGSEPFSPTTSYNPKGCAGAVISTTGTTVLNSLVVSAIPAAAVSGTGFSAGDAISGPGIAAGTTIAAVTSTTAITLSQPATAAGTAVALTVTPVGGTLSGPAITSQPSSTTVQAPNSAQFVALANGAPAPSVQWQVNTGSGFVAVNAADTGSNTPTLTVPSTSPDYANNAKFACGVHERQWVGQHRRRRDTDGHPGSGELRHDVLAASVDAGAGRQPDAHGRRDVRLPELTDTVSSTTVTLAPGLLANPAAVPTRCSPAQLTSYTCPAASQIGQGFVTARVYDATGVDGVETLPASMFLMPEPAGQTAILAQVGLVVYLDGQGIVNVTGNATLDSSGQVELAFTGLPSQVTVGTGITAVTEKAQVQAISLSVDATVNGNAFAINPSECVSRPHRSGDRHPGGDRDSELVVHADELPGAEPESGEERGRRAGERPPVGHVRGRLQPDDEARTRR